MSSFSYISQETQAILNTIGSCMQPPSTQRLGELISLWCASGNFREKAYFWEMIFEKLLQECKNKISIDKQQFRRTLHQYYHRLQQNIQQRQRNIQQQQRNIQQQQRNIQQQQRNIQQPQRNMQQRQQNIQQRQQNIQQRQRNIQQRQRNLQLLFHVIQQQPQQNIQQRYQNTQQLLSATQQFQQNLQPHQNIQRPQQNIQQPQQNIQQQPQQNIHLNQQLGQDSPPPGRNGTPQESRDQSQLSQRWPQRFQTLSWGRRQGGQPSQWEQYKKPLYMRGFQLVLSGKMLQVQLQHLQQRLQRERQQLEGGQGTEETWKRPEPQGNQHLPQQPHHQQGESPQHMEDLLILACQFLTGLPDDDTLMGDLVDGIMYADIAGVPIKKAANYLSTERLSRAIGALEAKKKRGILTFADETLREVVREKSLQDSSVVSILQAVNGDARRVWTLTELPEPLKELFHVPFQRSTRS